MRCSKRFVNSSVLQAEGDVSNTIKALESLVIFSESGDAQDPPHPIIYCILCTDGCVSLPEGLTDIMSHRETAMEQAPQMEKQNSNSCPHKKQPAFET